MSCPIVGGEGVVEDEIEWKIFSANVEIMVFLIGILSVHM